MRNTPIARIGNYRVYEHTSDDTFELVDDFGPVHYITWTRNGHFGGTWRFRPTLGQPIYSTMFDAVQTLP